MKILGIHGRATNLSNTTTTWHKRISSLEALWHEVYVPQLDPSEDPSYESWAHDLDAIDFTHYDVIIAVSHGSWVLAKYIKENNIKFNRVVFCCPGRWSHTNTWKVYDYLESHDMNLEWNVDQIIIVHSRDDEVIPYSESLKFQDQIWGQHVSLDWLPHRLDWEWIYLINKLALEWITFW